MKKLLLLIILSLLSFNTYAKSSCYEDTYYAPMLQVADNLFEYILTIKNENNNILNAHDLAYNFEVKHNYTCTPDESDIVTLFNYEVINEVIKTYNNDFFNREKTPDEKHFIKNTIINRYLRKHMQYFISSSKN